MKNNKNISKIVSISLLSIILIILIVATVFAFSINNSKEVIYDSPTEACIMYDDGKLSGVSGLSNGDNIIIKKTNESSASKLKINDVITFEHDSKLVTSIISDVLVDTVGGKISYAIRYMNNGSNEILLVYASEVFGVWNGLKGDNLANFIMSIKQYLIIIRVVLIIGLIISMIGLFMLFKSLKSQIKKDLEFDKYYKDVVGGKSVLEEDKSINKDVFNVLKKNSLSNNTNNNFNKQLEKQSYIVKTKTKPKTKSEDSYFSKIDEDFYNFDIKLNTITNKNKKAVKKPKNTKKQISNGVNKITTAPLSDWRYP